MSESPDTGDWPGPAVERPVDRPTVAGYEILEELGRGGMGVVYKARQLGPDRLVALKLIRDGALAGPQAVARFRIEAEAARQMCHPNIVRVYDVGDHAGRPYLAMEFVAGGGLDTHLASRPQPVREAADLARTLALAVAHAHEHKIVHRDLKPANILLNQKSEIRGAKSESADSDFALRISDFDPKVSDFGLAKRLDTQSTAWTHDGAVLGTPGYMAPEQAAGRVQEIGPWTDVYALGAVTYELLVGHPPFRAGTWDQTLQQVMQDEPVPPSRLRPELPPDLEAICLKCLEKDPARRYAAAGELADDLGRFLTGQPVAAVPPSAVERLARAASRDGYRIVDEIGRGPCSVVYRARHDSLNQPVAVKVYPAGGCTRDEWEARLRKGADLWATVAHPQVVPVHRGGWWDGAGYVVMEYVPHGSLAAWLTGRPRPVRESLRLVAQLAEVVAYLHRQGVVHGNLKPANVLMAANGIPRLTDFHPTGGQCLGPLPAADREPGGVGDLAPERIRNPTVEVRPYTDIYGLGLILYGLLTGRPAFEGATAGDVLEQVAARDPAPPSRRNRQVTPAVEWVCLKCLRKNPWRRFVRAYDLVTRLRRLADDPAGPATSDQRRPGRRTSGE